MSRPVSRRSAALLIFAAALLAFGMPAHAQAEKATFSGTVVAARDRSIVVRTSSGISTLAVNGNLGIVLAAGMRGTPEPITISGELEHGAVATFATSTMKIVAASVPADGRTAELLGGGSVFLDWGITKPTTGKSMVFVGRLEGKPSGVAFTVASDPQGGH